MNGIEFSQVITQKFQLPVVLISADDKDDTILKGLKGGAAVFIAKPISDDLRDLWQESSSYVSENCHQHIKKGTSKRKSAIEQGNADIDNSVNSVVPKKAKVEWTTPLHHKFLVAITEIGLDRVSPLKILDHMKVPGLTRNNVASHLQKYRIFLLKVIDASCKTQAADKNIASKAVQENCGLEKQVLGNTSIPSSSIHTSAGYLTGNLQHLKNKGKEVNATQGTQRIGDCSTSFMNQGNVQPHQGHLKGCYIFPATALIVVNDFFSSTLNRVEKCLEIFYSGGMRPIFCGNVEYNARQSEFERLFRRYGKVDRVDMKSGFAFVYMDDERDAEDAIRGLDRIEFGSKGRRLRIEWSKEERSSRRPETSRKSSSSAKPSKTLFVINFDPYSTRSRDIERHFDPYGKILNIRIRRNFAFVQYETQEDATRALDATNMSKLMDQVITVEYANKDDDDRRNGFSPDRNRDKGLKRGYDRGRSRSPYGRERGSPDYGRDRARSPSPIRQGRSSPDYGHRPSPNPNHRERDSEYGSGRSPSMRKDRNPDHGNGHSPNPRRLRAVLDMLQQKVLFQNDTEAFHLQLEKDLAPNLLARSLWP
ncbi:hypothetical protein K7X08_004011 [Anisodus acutangulus]|uniref:Uncharacterized protein n=1 Tax=Anisodus acutangulus TaxID=402998 RepID=A0A9Q1MJV8_9SOLA|nr:hypothetical protein K7X08_004011 [Anisodus acutangulus]